jgi:hypothetical protein
LEKGDERTGTSWRPKSLTGETLQRLIVVGEKKAWAIMAKKTSKLGTSTRLSHVATRVPMTRHARARLDCSFSIVPVGRSRRVGRTT